MRALLHFIQDEKGTISVKGNAGKATEAHQESDLQIETPTGARHVMVLLNEINFSQDQKINSQSNRWLAISPKDVPRVM